MLGFCQDRTIIITGAGSGFGRAYAYLLAREGANIIANDINDETLSQTVEHITQTGGQAIKNLDDITDYSSAGKIVQSALDKFGDLHGVVNNAGNNRDRMFTSLTEEEWDDVIRVHLKGHFCLSSHAAKYWRAKQKNGQAPNARIINTSSGAGLNGSVGQSNYAAAKAGILALTLNQSAELARYGVTANAIAPQGRTAMTEVVFADMMKKPEDGGFDEFDPANVAPLVAYLCSEKAAHINGHCFEAFGGKISVANGWKTGAINDKHARYEIGELDALMRKLIMASPPAQKVYGT